MQPPMDPDVRRSFYISLIGATLRYLFLFVGAWLKATGRAPIGLDSMIERITAHTPELAANFLLIATAVWTGVQKWRSHTKLQSAKDSPAGKTIE